VIRTHDAGALRAEHVGQTVTLAGWVARRRDHGGVAFLDLREGSGLVQVVVRDEAVAHSLRSEYVVKVTGQVSARPAGNANPNLPSGEIEVIADEVEVLNASAPLPFPVDDHIDVGEEVRLRHRYLDLRRTGPNQALRLRSKVNRAAREVLDGHDFVEIETPTLTRSTPEGARDFLVPARLKPGSWYALPQSPQLFKQLLMVAGMERYFQIARCYRDEDFRADRQPEFTQLDLEMSFVEQDDVLAIAEEILVAIWKLIGVDVPTPLPRMTYAESMARFGSDKPDLRMGQELVDVTDYFKDTTFRRRTSGRSSCPGARASRASSSTPGRSGPSSAAPAGSPTSWSRTTAGSGDRSPRTSPTTRRSAWRTTSAPRPATPSSSRPARSSRAAHSWGRRGSRSAAAAA
jgi:aspartyl-tRNA synthetase